MTQYEIELERVLSNGGNEKEFKEAFKKRVYASYKENVSSNKDEKKFRRGGFEIK